MNKEIVLSIILGYIKDNSDVNSSEEIPLDESLLSSGILDSFGIIEFVEFVESKFDINIPDEDFSSKNFGSVNNVIEYIMSKNEIS